MSALFLAGSAFGWGCEGHQMIALIARAHLTPAASLAIDRLLRENPIDPSLNRFCKDVPNDPMADSATWADDARNLEKTAEWHYIDIPLAIDSGSFPESDAMKWCTPLPDGRPGCIVTALETELAILRDTKQTGAARAKALRYVIHFAGDIAQPLHDVDNHDRGGNCTSITFFSEEKPQNLHAIWDYQLIEQELQATKSTQTQYAAKLNSSFAARWSEWGEQKAGILSWAWESHKLAETAAYGGAFQSGARFPVEPASAGPAADQDACNAERDKIAALHLSIGPLYRAQSMPVIREQLAKAGYRLAGLLNAAFQ